MKPETKDRIQSLIKSVKACYDDVSHDQFPPTDKLATEIIESDFLNDENFNELIKRQDSQLEASLLKRIRAVNAIQNSRNNGHQINTGEIARLLISSVLELDSSHVVSSIGSQGFLSIPISRHWKPLTEFDMLRIHIWDDSLNQHIDQEKLEIFSIHSHKFHAQSWVIKGTVINRVYDVTDSKEATDYSLFNITSKELNKVNRHTSVAENTNRHVVLNLQREEEHSSGESYAIPVGEFHQSRITTSPKPVITIFSFNALEGTVMESFVVGPSAISESEVNRKTSFDPKPILLKLEL